MLFGFVEVEIVVVVDDFFVGEFEVVGVCVEEVVYVDFGEFDVVLVVFEFV